MDLTADTPAGPDVRAAGPVRDAHGATQPDPPRLLTVAEAAQRLRVARSTIYALVQRHELRVTRLGHSVRVSTEEIERVIREGTAGG